jgi:Tol biopolymer transport system component
MKEDHSMIELKRLAAGLTLGLGLVLAAGCGAPAEQAPAESTGDAKAPEQTAEPSELPVARIPHPGEAAEAYFSPDGQSLIGNAKLEGDDSHQVYTMKLDGTEVRRINAEGEDACSYYFPDGQRLIWTSTKDHPELSEGANYSDPNNYPQGAELYVSALDGSDVERLTNNEYYDAEVSISPDGQWILFSRQIDGQVDLWRMRSDGTGEEQITHTPEEQEGGSFFLPDSETILYRSWLIEDQGQRGMPMTIYTIKGDGTEKTQITHEHGTNWAPYPAPDGKHFAFVKMLPPHNFEVFLMNIETGEQRRMTYNDAFDGFPSISPDGKTLAFSSSRDAAPGERKLYLHTMDVSSLNLGAVE